MLQANIPEENNVFGEFNTDESIYLVPELS